MIVHLPLAMAMLAVPATALLAWFVWRKKAARGLAGLVGALLLGLAASAFVAVETGENDEEVVEKVVPEAALETHEHRAERFLWGAMTLAGLGIATFISVRANRFAPALATVLVLGAGGVAWLAIDTGDSGGELVFVHGAADAWRGAATPNANPDSAPKAADHDDDD
jgi:uncharacterized membrane protein